MEKKSLYIYKLDEQGNKVKFPNSDMPAKLGEYTYSAQRMAGTPTLTATLNYLSCLDDLWSGEEFVEFRGEKYYVDQIPTSSKDNKSIMYKHELQFVSERIVLENVYFMDVVTAGADTYHSNSTSVKFMGDINEFVGRLNASMTKSGIGYSVVIDDDITSDSKLISLDDVYLADALQSIYTIYELPYYFVGKVCHIGYTENVISTPFEYRKGLVSIKKTNANYKIVNRVTGVGSSDNIPFYYPNDDEKGTIERSQNLMPSIYRESGGAERFYNALNNKYKIPGTNNYYSFKNTYSAKKVKEIKVDFSDIKPTIEGVTNASGQLFGEIADIAFDANDSDELGTGTGNNVFNGTDEYVHSYFYIKLHIYNGDYGFNLFEQGLEGGTAVINMTTGNCAACEFEIGVAYKDNNPKRAFNPVLVDSAGNLPAGDFEQKVTSNTSQYVAKQQDTSTNSVWIAVKKDNTSLGIVMPNATNNYRPSVGDKFVITGIKMPKSLVLAAEKRLDEALVKYMSENNDEKFTFSVNFSRVFLADNIYLWDILNENSRIYIKYNDREYLMYVNSFTCKADKNCLYDISVELTDKLSANVSALRSTITEIAGNIIGNTLGSSSGDDALAKTSKHYIRKDQPDSAKYLINFLSGIHTGIYHPDNSGGMIDAEGNAELNNVSIREVAAVDEVVSKKFTSGLLGVGHRLLNGVLEVSELIVRKTMHVFEIIVQKTTSVNGSMLTTPGGGIKIYGVEKLEDGYKCLFNNDDGTIPNPFVVGDQGLHQVFTGKNTGRYWRLVTEVGDNYFVLSKTDCEPGSGIPREEDEIIQFGNRTDKSRQNAVLTTSYGADAPYTAYYSNVNSYSLEGKEDVREGNLRGVHDPDFGQLQGSGFYSKNVYLKGIFRLMSGKTVSSAIDDVDKKADEAIDAAGQARNLADSAQKAADSAQQTANDAKSNALSAENSALEAKRAADNAHTAASAVNAELAKINDDNTISPSEKTALKQQQKDIQSEYNEIISSATRYSINSTNYQNAYLSADSALIKYTSDTPEYIPIDSDYTNIGDYYTARQTILDAISSAANKKAEDAAKAAAEAATEASAAQAAADAALGALNNVNALIKDLQNQVDGAIQSYDGNVVPTLQNYPASEWSEEQEKIRHLGDIYYYYSTDAEGNSVTSTYKFRKVNGIYLWEKVANSESAANEAAIRELFNITNSKNSVYYGNTRPTPPYSVNDVWVKMDGSMYICNAGRSDGDTGLSTDWAIFNDAMLRLAKITSDDIISKEEKSSLRDIWSQIQKEFAKYQIQATTYSVSITTLRNAYDSLNTFLTNTAEISQDTDTSFSVPQKTQYNQLFADYYAARTDFANLIADKIAAGAVGSIQVGDTNLLDNSNKPWKSSNYLIASIQLGDYKPKHGEECTIVMKCKLGAGKEYFGVYNSGGRIRITDIGPLHINSDGIAVKTFPWVVSSAANTYINIYVISDAVVVESEIEWVKLVLGNKTSLQWTPSLNDQKETARQESQQVVDNLQIGSVNLISKKMMLRWNEKNKNIAVWGQDADGVYLGIHQGLLFSNWAESEALLNPIFDIKFKANTQYALSVEWKLGGKQAHAGLYLNICYTDGSKDYIVILNNQTTKIREDLVSQHGKTISKISSSYGSSEYRTYIYNISLIEGNKPLQGFPVAEEDSIGSSVNLANGTKEFTATALSGQNYEYGRCPMRVKPNTVYHVQAGNIENLSGNPSAYSFRIYNKDISQILALEPWVKNYDKNGGLLITKNDFEEQDGYLLCYAGVAGSTSGNSVKYTEVMLVEGFYPATAWVPSAGDVSKEISDVSSALSSFQTTVNGTFKDGIINKVEADTIASNINLLNTEKKDIDAQYTDLYSNTYLSGTAKTNLANAKTAYNTAHTNLINSINSAIADKKVTAAEKSDVNAKFTAYGTALATYQTRVQQAQKAIQDKVRESSVGDITKGSSYYVGKFSFAQNFGIFEFATTIPEKTNQMINVKISGYCYGDHTPFGMSLVFYTHETGMINYGYIVNGGDFISRVRLGIKNGKVRIELKLIKDVYYPGFNVDISSTRFDIPVSYSAGWTCVAKLISAGDYIDSTYSDIVTVPRKNSFSDALASKAQQAANNAQAAINAMNDDSIFDVQEKQIIRTQWENINGAANTTGTGTSGSYYKTKSLATGLSVSALDTAYTALRAYLHSMALYTNSNTSNFARATMAAKFTTYYDAEIAINNAITNKLTQDYTDSKTYKTYIFDTATNEFDENKYYPITVKIPIAPEVKIAVSSVLRGSNKPLWSTHASGFSDICIWRTNGSGWGSSNVYRRIETFEYRFTKHEISPLGDVNQITQTSEEYIYVRGGGRYVVRIYGSEYNPPKIYTTAHTFPIDDNGNKGSIGPLDLTALFAQLNTATGEDIERIKNEINKIIKPPVVALKKIETQTEFNSERLSLIATETQYDELEKAGQTIVNRIDVVGSGISILSDKVNSIESSMAGMLVESDFVNIFAKYKDNAALSDAVISSINVSPEGVRIDGKNITITGQTLFKNNSGDTINFFGSGDDVFSINNGVFKVDKNGKLTATDATIEGNITANEGKFGGWVISSGAFVSNDFEYPVWGNDTVSGGKGSRISPDGGLMIMASGNGILRPSSGAKQAALIKAEGNNSHIIGLEVVARNTNSYGTFNEVIALKLRAETAYKNPATPPIALHIEKGDLIVQDGNFSASGAFSLGCQTVTSTTTLSSNTPHMILCKNTSEITVYLPKTAGLGRIIYVRRCNARVVVHGNGNNIYRKNSPQADFGLTDQGHMGRFEWGGDGWYTNWIDI